MSEKLCPHCGTYCTGTAAFCTPPIIEETPLKPCPFCSHRPHHFIVTRLDAHRIMCVNRKCPVKPSTSNHRTNQEATVAWNTRA